MKKLVVIGGVAAGMSAASKLKRLDPEYEITVFEKGKHVSYGACGLPYYVSGENKDYTKMIARTEEQFEASGISVHTKHEIVKVIPEEKKLLVKDLAKNKLFIETYGKLMISTGAFPIVPPLANNGLKNIFVLKTLEDGIALQKALSDPSVQNAVIVGGGYIGLEAAEALLALNKQVRLIERGERLLKSFDRELTEKVESHLIDKGVRIHLKESVQGFMGTEKVEGIATHKGSYEADLVILALGAKPATGFLEGSGIQLAANGAVIIDRQMQTNVEDVYAAGDCAEVYHRVLEKNAYIPLGTNANKCGRLAGANMAGIRQTYAGTLGSAAIKVCDLELGRTGLSEEEAKRHGFEFGTVFVESKDRPAYYPNQTELWVKLIVEKKSRKLLGAQILGKKNAVLRIDAFAVAIHQGMTVDELGLLDLAYAPPFAGVWDAIHIACNAYKE